MLIKWAQYMLNILSKRQVSVTSTKIKPKSKPRIRQQYNRRKRIGCLVGPAYRHTIPEVDSTELLLVNPHFISSSTFEAKITNGEYMPSVAEKEIIEVYKRLKWCPGNPIIRKENSIGHSSAEMSCHGKEFPSRSFSPSR